MPTETNSFNGNIRPANLFHHNPLNYAEGLVWNHTFGPTLINEARFNVSRWYFDELASNPQEPWGLPEGTITGLPSGVNNINQIVYGANPPGIFFKTGYNIQIGRAHV